MIYPNAIEFKRLGTEKRFAVIARNVRSVAGHWTADCNKPRTNPPIAPFATVITHPASVDVKFTKRCNQVKLYPFNNSTHFSNP